jgi:hypothetical protein
VSVPAWVVGCQQIHLRILVKGTRRAAPITTELVQPPWGLLQEHTPSDPYFRAQYCHISKTTRYTNPFLSRSDDAEDIRGKVGAYRKPDGPLAERRARCTPLTLTDGPNSHMDEILLPKVSQVERCFCVAPVLARHSYEHLLNAFK